LRIVDLNIEDIAFGGKGIARENGRVVFIPFTIEGEKISAEIVREKKQFAEAELVDLRESSPHRVQPECPYFGRCGGCSYQHIDYEHQLAIKWRQVRDVLRRIGKLKNPPMRPIVPSPTPYGYRNRITVHAQDGVIGFFGRESNRLIDIEHCRIAMDEVNRALAELRAQHVRNGHYTLRAERGPRVFSQANDVVANALRESIVKMIPTDQGLLIDAYCGAGFFAKVLLGKFQRVIGIDWDRFAIEIATKNASTKETYIAGDIEVELQKVGAIHLNRPSRANNIQDERLGSIAPTFAPEKTTVIVDPPASGLTANVRQALVDLAPATLIYISCNPPTLARDLADLQQTFAISSVTPFDMFPQTAEIEVAVHLQAS
jgi:tRNA/tmRNA/rRNA uracil-C5-methylase (TrmA/RlmC/RlmD family)